MIRRVMLASTAALVLVSPLLSQAQEIDIPQVSVLSPADVLDTAAHAANPTDTPQARRPAPSVTARFEGALSYYGNEFAGRRTATGERFDPTRLTMAHLTLPFGTLVRVTNLRNNKSVVVRVNDRGPHTGGRIGDVSAAAAAMLDMLRAGIVRARLEVLGAHAAP